MAETLLDVADQLSRVKRLACALDAGIDGIEVAVRDQRDGLAELVDLIIDELDTARASLEEIRAGNKA